MASASKGTAISADYFVIGAHADPTPAARAPSVPLINSLLDRRPTLVTAVALANKTARIAWAIWRGEAYRSALVSPVVSARPINSPQG